MALGVGRHSASEVVWQPSYSLINSTPSKQISGVHRGMPIFSISGTV